MKNEKLKALIGLTALICTIGTTFQPNCIYADEKNLIVQTSA